MKFDLDKVEANYRALAIRNIEETHGQPTSGLMKAAKDVALQLVEPQAKLARKIALMQAAGEHPYLVGHYVGLMFGEMLSQARKDLTPAADAEFMTGFIKGTNSTHASEVPSVIKPETVQ